MPRLSPKPPEKPVETFIRVNRPCDKCGLHAWYQVDVESGTLYFCLHHFELVFGHIFSEGYNVTRIGPLANGPCKTSAAA
jgi:hypothetical protein